MIIFFWRSSVKANADGAERKFCIIAKADYASNAKI